VTVRLALPEDLDGALDTWRAAQAGRGLRPNAARVARVTEKLQDFWTTVALEDDVVVAMAHGEPGRLKRGAGDLDPGVLHVDMVFVRPEHQRQGLGGAVLDALGDVAWSKGFRSLSVWSETPAFYEAVGFDVAEVDGARTRLTAELEAPMRQVVVSAEGIRLGQFLKLAELVDTGSEGKALLEAGEVEVNGEVETRRGRQMVTGDVVRTRDQAVEVAAPPG
jgi:ribosome-associated protein